MSTTEILLKDPDFNIEQSAHAQLVIDLSWDRMAWAVFDNQRSMWVLLGVQQSGKLQLPGQLLDKIREIVETHETLKYSFENTHILWGGLNYTLLPQAMVKEGNNAEYLQFTSTMHAGDKVLSDHITSLDARNIYSIPSILHAGMEQLWPGHHLQHSMSCLVSHLLKNEQDKNNSTKAYIQISTQSFDLIIINKGELQYCNTYEHRTSEDLIYYIMFTFEQLKIEIDQCSVAILGELSSDDIIFQYMEKYISQLTFMQANPACNASAVLQDIPAHRFYNLLNRFA